MLSVLYNNATHFTLLALVLSVLLLLAIVLSVLLQFTDSDYHFEIFKFISLS
jgi:hypothetical protein